jgi:hypothetical protein
MILKFFSQGEWHYIDNISDFSTQFTDSNVLVHEYMASPPSSDKISAPNHPCTPTQATEENVFVAGANRCIKGIEPYEVIPHNAVNLSIAEAVNPSPPVPVCIVTAVRGKEKHIVVTTGDAFLMNDKGQTIERLV